MPIYSDKSKQKLATCDKRLQLIFNKAIKHFDNTILFGHRDYTDQMTAFREGNSQLTWPNSKHNKFPSLGVDAAPYPIDWDDIERFRYFNGFIMGIATGLGIQLRCGCDWDMDTEVKDNKFNDLCHYELIDN